MRVWGWSGRSSPALWWSPDSKKICFRAERPTTPEGIAEYQRLLMQNLIGYARARGVSRLFGDILAENTAMLALSAQLGFKLDHIAPDVVRASLLLNSSI